MEPRAGEGSCPVPGGGNPIGNGEVVWVERKDGKGPETMGDGRSNDSGSPKADLGPPRTGHDGAEPPAKGSRTGGKPALGPERGLSSWINWQSALYAFVLGVLCVFLVPLTSLWWLVPVLGVAVPLALVAPGRSGSVPKRSEEQTSEPQSRQHLVCRSLF